MQIKFRLGQRKEMFMRQLEKDATFLASLNIMDYSLLIGIHDKLRLAMLCGGIFSVKH